MAASSTTIGQRVQQGLGIAEASRATWPAWAWPLAAGLGAMLERERSRWLLWLPVALGTGIALLFALPREPPDLAGWLAVGAGLGCVGLLLRSWRGAARVSEALLLAAATAFLGFALAQARIGTVAAPILARAGIYAVTGRVVDLAPLPKGERVLLDRVTLDGVASDATPARIRINLRRAPLGLTPGNRISVRARLQRPMGPALPGAFDFARQAWFEQLGAVGFSMGVAERLPGEADGFALALAELRARIAQRIIQENAGPAGAMAAALVAGVRAGIDQATWRAMQVSGLAHILSVSGLHMVMVAGSIFVCCRWLLALIQPLALRYPVKKPAAALALLAAAFYLLLSGSSVPAQRSFLMTAVALVAVMVDRNPFSLRLLAWAAVVVLLLRPEAVVGASFQLSFAAVLALMVVFEAWQRRKADQGSVEPGWLWGAWRYFAGVSATTLVAGTATMPFAAFHFQTIPTYGVLANLIVVPLTTFLVMPAGMLGLLLMPLGLEDPFFHVMTWGCEAVLWIARAVADLPGGSILVRQWPGSALALLTIGALWLALWQRSWRWAGLGPIVAALAVTVMTRPPDLLIDSTMRMAAVRGDDGEITLIEWRRDRLIRESWLRHLGVASAEKGPAVGSGQHRGVACDDLGCVADLGGPKVSLAKRVEAAVEDCGRVDLVIARVGPVTCRGGRLIGPRALRDSGGLAITRRGGQLEVATVTASRGDWPWNRQLTYRLK